MNVATKERPIERTVTQVASSLGLSKAVVRRHCQNGNVPGATYHEYPGTNVGYYTLTKASVEWLRENITPRQRDSEKS